MTLHQICTSWRTGGAVNVDGRVAQIVAVHEPASTVTVEFADGSSQDVRFWNVKHTDELNAYTAYRINDRIKSEHDTLEQAQNSPINPNAVLGDGRAWCKSALALDPPYGAPFWSETTPEFITDWLRKVGCEQ